MKRKIGNSYYQRDLATYKKVIVSMRQKQIDYIEKQKQKAQKKWEEWEDFYFFTSQLTEPILESREDNYEEREYPGLFLIGNQKESDVSSQTMSLDLQIKQLEEKKMITFQEECFLEEGDFDFFEVECFLYHGLRYFDDKERFEEGLKKLTGILEKRKIVAGKYLEGYYPSLDNCNELEYVSLASYSDSIEFHTFVLPNICLLVRPSSPAYQTIYVPYETWEYMKKNKMELRNRYSYAHNEYHVKDSIPIDDVKAIGLPHFNIRLSEGLSTANYYKEQIIDLLAQYDIDLPIVDTSCYNQVIYQKEDSKKFQK